MKKKKKRNKNYYFTKVHEQAIIKYVKTGDMREKTILYKEYIGPAFSEMVDKITFTYNFTKLPNVECLRDECKIWLTTILEKYNPDRGSKAFSYFSVITKNWFIQKTKQNAKARKRTIDINEIYGEIEQEFCATAPVYDKNREDQEFWALLLGNLDEWLEKEMTRNANSNDTRVLLAVKALLAKPDDLEILNKKAIYLYLREITGLTTKQIATSLKKYRDKYKVFKGKWNAGEY
jgi:hypothetical protein